MGDEPMFEGMAQVPERPRRHLAVAVILAGLMALAALAVATWLFLDRQELQERLVRTDERVAELREELGDAREEGEEAREDASSLEEERDRLTRARGVCRRAIRESVRMWNELVEALNAATEFDADAFERSLDQADARRADVNAALRRCERT